MEKHIENIELINQYLNNTLSENQQVTFQKKITTDANFKEIYEDHLSFLGGLKRIQLKEEIQIAHKKYIIVKWLKIIGVILAVLLISIFIYSLFFVNDKFENNESTTKHKDTLIENYLNRESSGNNQFSVIDTAKTIVVTPVVDTVKVIKNIIKNSSSVIEKGPITLVENNSLNHIAQFYKTVQKLPEEYIINTEKDTLLKCKEGTLLKIKANSFIDKRTNSIVKGNVLLKVTEYYTLSDMLLANLTTRSFDKQLETGGMLHIEVSKNNTSSLKLDKPISIEIPTKNKKTDMQLFMGQLGEIGINWVLNENQLSDELLEDRPLEDSEIIKTTSFASLEVAPSFPDCKGKSNQQKQNCISNKFSSLFRRKLDTELLQNLGLNNRVRILISFVIDSTGLITNINVRKPIHPEMQKEVERVLGLAPRLIPGKQGGKTVNINYSLPIDILFEGMKSNLKGKRTQQQDAIATPLSFRGRDARKLRYLFSTTRLGWINCDRFLNNTKPKIKYELKIKDSDDVDVKLVFKSIRSILPAVKYEDAFYFGNVPENEAVVLVAIKIENDQYYMATKDLKTEISDELELDFKQYSITQLKQKLAKLNHVF